MTTWHQVATLADGTRTAAQIASALNCSSAYVRATARRKKFKLLTIKSGPNAARVLELIDRLRNKRPQEYDDLKKILIQKFST